MRRVKSIRQEVPHSKGTSKNSKSNSKIIMEIRIPSSNKRSRTSQSDTREATVSLISILNKRNEIEDATRVNKKKRTDKKEMDGPERVDSNMTDKNRKKSIAKKKTTPARKKSTEKKTAGKKKSDVKKTADPETTSKKKRGKSETTRKKKAGNVETISEKKTNKTETAIKEKSDAKKTDAKKNKEKKTVDKKSKEKKTAVKKKIDDKKTSSTKPSKEKKTAGDKKSRKPFNQADDSDADSCFSESSSDSIAWGGPPCSKCSRESIEQLFQDSAPASFGFPKFFPPPRKQEL